MSKYELSLPNNGKYNIKRKIFLESLYGGNPSYFKIQISVMFTENK